MTDRRADRQTNGQTESLYQYDARQTLGSVELKDVKLLDSDTYLDSCYVSVKDNINRKVYSKDEVKHVEMTDQRFSKSSQYYEDFEEIQSCI